VHRLSDSRSHALGQASVEAEQTVFAELCESLRLILFDLQIAAQEEVRTAKSAKNQVAQRIKQFAEMRKDGSGGETREATHGRSKSYEKN
jgi:hypothetical protein